VILLKRFRFLNPEGFGTIRVRFVERLSPLTAQEKIAHRLTLQQCGKSNIEHRIIKGGAEALHAWVATL
jgi:ribosomal protein L32E